MTIADINTLARFLVGADTNSYVAANLLITVNAAYERIVGKILEKTSGSRWKFGDFNRTAFPTFSITMTNAIQSYDFRDWLTTTDQQTLSNTTPLVIIGVEVLDNSGEPHVLKRISLEEIHAQDIGFDNYQETDGLPQEYEIRDNLIVLYPAPATARVTLTNGLILYYLRSAEVFTSAEVTTGTKEPGIPRPYHDILAYEAAYTFAIAKGLDNANRLKAELDRKEKELLEFISKRDQDHSNRPIMTNKPIVFT